MKDNPVCILGMHRSGTSCLAGSLQLAGVQLGEVVESAPHNRKGNRENLRIRELNDAVLATSGGAWNAPPDAIRWTSEQAASRDALVDQFESLPGRHWGFKDPRTVLTLPFWQDRLPALRLVVTFRHPLAVARSLAARDTMPLDQGLRLWSEYNRRILSFLEAHAPPHETRPLGALWVSFDVPETEYRETIDLVVRCLALEGADIPAGQNAVFFDEALRHQSLDAGNQYTAMASDLSHIHSRLEELYRKFRFDHA